MCVCVCVCAMYICVFIPPSSTILTPSPIPSLPQTGHAYRCFCPPERLDALRQRTGRQVKGAEEVRERMGGWAGERREGEREEMGGRMRGGRVGGGRVEGGREWEGGE